MDKFVVRIKRELPTRKAKPTDEKELKQVTIPSLKRVVIVDDIHQAKAALEAKDQDKQVILDELKKLGSKIPSREVLKETGIGLTLNRLRKHEDSEVALVAKDLYKTWRKYFKDQQDKPQIEVRPDNKTSKLRQSGCKLIRDAITVAIEDVDTFAEATERCIWQLNGSTNTYYKKHMRATVFLLRHQPDIQEKLRDKKLTVDQLCEMKYNNKKT